jgi:hypothetical protein
MLHAYVERFDVMGGRGNILGWDWEVIKALVFICTKMAADWIGSLRARCTAGAGQRLEAEGVLGSCTKLMKSGRKVTVAPFVVIW